VQWTMLLADYNCTVFIHLQPCACCYAGWPKKLIHQIS